MGGSKYLLATTFPYGCSSIIKAVIPDEGREKEDTETDNSSGGLTGDIVIGDLMVAGSFSVI
jgi:hypothetical protein